MTTTRSRRQLSPAVHLPLRRIALCLDCEECFEIGYSACPACGCETWTSLARFLDKTPADDRSRHARGRDAAGRPAVLPVAPRVDGKGKTTRHLLIVARNRHELYDQLEQAFSANERVQVMLDRRSGADRRNGRAPRGLPVAERRLADRRRRSIDEQLRTMGWALVLLDD